MKRNILQYILVGLLAFLPLLLSFYLNVFSPGFYSHAFQKYGVISKYPDMDMTDYNKNVLSYLSGKNEKMPEGIFLNEREIGHMADVKRVFEIFFILFYGIIIGIISLLILLLVSKKKIFTFLEDTLFFSGIVSLAFGLVLLLFFILSFNSSFEVFHRIFFAEGSWLFEASDNIVNIYPLSLFSDLATRIFSGMIFISVLFILTGKYRKIKRLLPRLTS